MRLQRANIAAKVFAPVAANRQLAGEPLTADDWRRVWEARQNFLAAIRQIVFNARIREAELSKAEELSDAASY